MLRTLMLANAIMTVMFDHAVAEYAEYTEYHQYDAVSACARFTRPVPCRYVEAPRVSRVYVERVYEYARYARRHAHVCCYDMLPIPSLHYYEYNQYFLKCAERMICQRDAVRRSAGHTPCYITP